MEEQKEMIKEVKEGKDNGKSKRIKSNDLCGS